MIGLGWVGGEAPVVLALGAHADDVEIGCAATLRRLAAGGSTVHYGVLSATPERAAEAAAAAADLLGERLGVLAVGDLRDGRFPAQWDQVKDALEELAVRTAPAVVLAPRLDDAHQDHRTLAELVPTVFRDALVLGYEIPKLDGDRGRCDVYVPLHAQDVQRKWDLLDRHYASQRGRHWWDREVIEGSARLRGVECRAPYAEGFTCSKAVLALPAGTGSEET